MYQLELDPNVISFREQPITMQVTVNGKAHRYTPDLEVMTKRGKVIEEIKPAQRVAEYAELFDAVSRAFEDAGIPFVVITDTEIRRRPYMDNVSYLLRFRYFDLDEPMVACVRRLVRPRRIATFLDLKQAFSEADLPAWGPWALLAHSALSIDLEAPIVDASPVSLNEEICRCLP
ncbi:TnsA endonuclease N-terminal domain-containing protein [Kordiimonas marina]|uniref:TnsA endonuclease N-terminal domain-containing protein n=1 Tax=Kordiimonas marina TaxID=2872312 RepID=UPI001FF65E82|nr:TnsA endonuclease N-terminal domain-containing protein [Kordiimonas marina]MCJ9430022.1 TnsA endonuclease N-terminal domain-containing protein [Kordiimonas marina]